jgi:hypothetical protein
MEVNVFGGSPPRFKSERSPHRIVISAENQDAAPHPFFDDVVCAMPPYSPDRWYTRTSHTRLQFLPAGNSSRAQLAPLQERLPIPALGRLREPLGRPPQKSPAYAVNGYFVSTRRMWVRTRIGIALGLDNSNSSCNWTLSMEKVALRECGPFIFALLRRWAHPPNSYAPPPTAERRSPPKRYQVRIL